MNESQADIYEFDKFRLDANKRLLFKEDEEPIALMPKAFDTLLFLVQNHGKVVEKDELLSEIWTDTIVEENNLTQNISNLRRIFGEKPGENRFIATVPGKGYKFVAAVREISKTENAVEDQKTEFETVQNVSPSTASRTETEHQPPASYKNQSRFRFFVIFTLLISGSLAFYFWRGNINPAADAPVKTIAVLPFKPLAAESRNETLEFGMADALINKLSSSEEIIVRPLGSVRRYNALEQDVLQAGRELGVDSVLEGTIQISDDRIRIAARLIRTNDGKQIWTETFDEKFTDIFTVQDSISQKVLAALTLKLSGEEQKRLTKRYTENVEAYQLYMKGRFHASRLILPEAVKGIGYYEQAIALDPNYALAYAGIAQAYAAFSLSGDIPANEAMTKGKAAALKALELDPNLPEAQVAVGFIAFWYDWNWAEAEKKYQRAIELDPHNERAQYFYAHLNSNLGNHTEALTMVKRARELDPLSLITNSAEGQFLFFAGQPDEAVSRLQKTLELDPAFWHAHLVLSKIYAEQKMFPEAVAEAEKAAQFSGGNSEAVAQKAYALAKSGNAAEARAVLNELQKTANEKHVPAYNFAIIYNALGETENALAQLEKAYTEKNVLMVFLKADPKWNNLRNEPRFIDLMRRMNFL